MVLSIRVGYVPHPVSWTQGFFKPPWRPSPHHLVIIPSFCHLQVLLGHVLSPNPVSKKTGSTSNILSSVWRICGVKSTLIKGLPLDRASPLKEPYPRASSRYAPSLV